MVATPERPGPARAGVERMYEALRSAIVENRLAPGQRLIEQRLASEYGASRTPVREALRRLEAEGLVVTEPHRGAVVRPISVDEVIDLYGLRARLESYATSLAAERRSDEHLGDLTDAVVSFGAAAADFVPDSVEDLRRLADANRAVHDTILLAARHDRLATMLSRTVDIPLVFQSLRRFGPDERSRSDMFHRLILGAIERRDAQRAGALMFEHIHQGLDVVLRDLDDRDGVDDARR